MNIKVYDLTKFIKKIKKALMYSSPSYILIKTEMTYYKLSQCMLNFD